MWLPLLRYVDAWKSDLVLLQVGIESIIVSSSGTIDHVSVARVVSSWQSPEDKEPNEESAHRDQPPR